MPGSHISQASLQLLIQWSICLYPCMLKSQVCTIMPNILHCGSNPGLPDERQAHYHLSYIFTSNFCFFFSPQAFNFVSLLQNKKKTRILNVCVCVYKHLCVYMPMVSVYVRAYGICLYVYACICYLCVCMHMLSVCLHAYTICVCVCIWYLFVCVCGGPGLMLGVFLHCWPLYIETGSLTV